MFIKTNSHQRELKSLSELSEEIVLFSFDYLYEDWYSHTDEAYTTRFFKYRGSWYNIQEFENNQSIPKWDAVQTESYFSAVLVRWGKDWAGELDYDSVVVGYAHW